MELLQFKQGLNMFSKLFGDFYITGSLVLKHEGILQRNVGDLDIIIDKKNFDKSKLEGLKYKEQCRNDNFFCESNMYSVYNGYGYGCLLIKNKDFDSIDIDINGKTYKAMSPRDIITNKENIVQLTSSLRTRKKHEQDIKDYNKFINK